MKESREDLTLIMAGGAETCQLGGDDNTHSHQHSQDILSFLTSLKNAFSLFIRYFSIQRSFCELSADKF